jgi:hypothetical protein
MGGHSSAQPEELDQFEAAFAGTFWSKFIQPRPVQFVPKQM